MVVNQKKIKVDEKVAFISGGTGGFGEVLLNKFRGNGYFVAYTSKKGTGLNNEFFLWDKVNASSLAENTAYTEKIMDKWGRIDVLVVNAAVNYDNILAKTADWEINEMVDINLKGFFTSVKAVLPHMINQNSGSIIAVSSYSGSCGREGQSVYSASKAGLIGAVKSFAKEVGRYDIKVNAVLPGFMNAGMGARSCQKVKDKALEENVLGRLTDAGESAEFIVGLCGMNSVSGQIFNLDSRIVGWL